jgi:molecular chaperone GrpE
VAELDNFRKRTERKLQDERLYIAADYLSIVFDTIDDLSRLEKAIQAIPENDPFLKALELIKSKLKDKLQARNIVEIPALGCQFNPNLHEVLMELEHDTANAGEIIDVYAAGYLMDERPLRAAKVLVAKPKELPKDNETQVNE